MSETSPLDKAIAITDVAKAAKEVLPQTVNEADGAIATLVGWFNNVVLFPVKKANITYRYKLECFEDDLKNKVLQIPSDRVCEPNLMIAGPTLEALKYTYDEQELRDMYTNLLASSMDSDKKRKVHPTYVDIIRQLTPDEAKLIRELSTKSVFPLIHVKQYMKDGKSFNDVVVNHSSLGRVCCDYPENIYSYFDNLNRLGLVNISYSSCCTYENAYDELDAHFDALRESWEKKGGKIKIVHGLIELSALGKCFSEICIAT